MAATDLYLITHRHRETGEYLTTIVPLDDDVAGYITREVYASGSREAGAAARARLVDEMTAAFAIESDVVDVEPFTVH